MLDQKKQKNIDNNKKNNNRYPQEGEEEEEEYEFVEDPEVAEEEKKYENQQKRKQKNAKYNRGDQPSSMYIREEKCDDEQDDSFLQEFIKYQDNKEENATDEVKKEKLQKDRQEKIKKKL